MPESSINPWSSTPSLDVEKTFAEFGIDPIAPVLHELPEIPYFMRRGIVVGQRDYLPIARAIRNHTPFHLLTGFMPSGHPHLGHLMLMREVVWHVQQGANGYVTIADREAFAVRGLSWEKCREYGKEYLSCLFALGFEGETYFQSKNGLLKDLAFEAATKVNFSELTAIYGFSPETALAHEFRMFTVEERDGYVSVRSKNAPDAALEAIKKAFPHAKKYEGHVDIKDAICADVSAKVREIERACGGYAFYTPSSTYHIFLPGLTGGKMSSSIPESIISFYEPEAAVRKNVMSGLTGGRMTLEEQRRLGGEPEKCTLYLLNMFHMITDDAKLAELHRKCRSGEITCGQCKKETAERVVAFLKDFREKMDVAAETIEV